MAADAGGTGAEGTGDSDDSGLFTAGALDAEGNPLFAGKKAWLTRVARGFQPKPKAPKPPRDPNAPLTAGQKAQLTRAARKADPNYQPPKPAKAKVEAKVRLDAAIGAAFPVESAPAAAVEAVA